MVLEYIIALTFSIRGKSGNKPLCPRAVMSLLENNAFSKGINPSVMYRMLSDDEKIIRITHS